MNLTEDCTDNTDGDGASIWPAHKNTNCTNYHEFHKGIDTNYTNYHEGLR